jgi:hypothetical protein
MKASPFILVAAASFGFAFAASAADTWNGTWAGNVTDADTAQLIFADDQLVGFFWDGDYLSAVSAKAQSGGTIVAITWAAGTATLTRDGPQAAHLTVQQKGKPDVTVALMPDS